MTDTDVLSEPPQPAAVAPSDPAEDRRFMDMALLLGRRGLGNTWPNPAVGAVVVKDGIVLGRGWTQPGGRPHAETQALKRAGEAAKGATLYVTLEPCSHQGKTRPCADAIVKAGIARVVSAMEDPNPEVGGKGHEKLRKAGIAVEIGLGAEEAKRDHAGHIRRITAQRPHVMLKLAVSADGKAGLATRKPIMITGEAARERVFLMRAQSDAIMIGIGTVFTDDPALTARLPGLEEERSPVRVVLDARMRAPLSNSVIATVRDTPTWLFGSAQASPMAEEVLRSKGVEVIRVPDQAGMLDLPSILKELAARGITRLMVEGGPTVAAALIKADLVDEAMIFHAEKQIGETGIPPLQGLPFEALSEKLRLVDSSNIGGDRLDRYERA